MKTKLIALFQQLDASCVKTNEILIAIASGLGYCVFVVTFEKCLEIAANSFTESAFYAGAFAQGAF